MNLKGILESKLTFPILVVGTVVVIISVVLIVWMNSKVTADPSPQPSSKSSSKVP